MYWNSLVDFLASYGPQAFANNMYDEYVTEAAKKTKCDPLKIPQPAINKVIKTLELPDPYSIILTGTAGDGKTYTARNAYQSLGGCESLWNDNKTGVIEYNYDGKVIEFIKDLSELDEQIREDLFPRLCGSFIKKSNRCFVICSNDGHLLSYFKNSTNHKSGEKIYEEILEMLRSGRVKSSRYRFNLINMSNRIGDDIVDNIIDQVSDHKNWKNCKGCPIFKNDKHPCPIRLNLKILKCNDDSSIRARLRDIAAIASASEKHIATRQLIMLIVNILLGDKKSHQNASHPRLLNCARARERAENLEYQYTNPYSNIFGDNLDTQHRYGYSVYSTLTEFNIGHESNNNIDQRIIGDCKSLPKSREYGTKILNPARKTYRDHENKNSDLFEAAMIDQRRRLFFSIENAQDNRSELSLKSPWKLSSFSYGGLYCKLIKEISENETKLSNDLKKVYEITVCGLNRIMTGFLTHTNDRLWIIEPAGEGIYGGKIPVVLNIAREDHGGEVRYSIKCTSNDSKVPCIELVSACWSAPARLILKPSLFEYICRVADGSIPSTFSSECQTQIARFQLKVSGLLESSQGSSGKTLSAPEVVSMQDGKLREDPIQVLRNWGGGDVN